MLISVIICVHNCKPEYFNRVLASLQAQTLTVDQWELIIIDNKSEPPVADWVDLSWHPDSKIVVEEKLGLIHARIRGTHESKHDILATVDDDTPLFPDYLEHVQRIYAGNSNLGIIGGRTVPVYETQPPQWLDEFAGMLAIRDLGEEIIIAQLGKGEQLEAYPACAPILIAPRRECMLAFIKHYEQSDVSQSLGRKGTSLASGEDNDINLFIYKNGWGLGYFPELKFEHIIPAKRMTVNYLQRMAYSSTRTWVKVLNLHGIRPWKRISPLTVTLRQVRAYFRLKAWKSDANYINWKAACGKLKGQSEIK